MKRINLDFSNKKKLSLDTVSLLTKSFKLAFSSPKIIIYMFLSLVLTLTAFIAIFSIFYFLLESVLLWIETLLSFGSVWESIITWTLRIISIISFALIVYFTFTILGLLISIPLLDLISEETEKILEGKSDCECPFFKGMIASIKSASLLTIKRVVILILTIPLLFIPVLGTIVFFIINSFKTSYEFVDIPMARRGWDHKKKKLFFKENTTLYERFIFGAITHLLLLVPFLNLIIYPICTVAGTIFFLDMRKRKNPIIKDNDVYNIQAE